MAYYNTTGETQQDCSEFNVKNMKQDEIVLAVATNLETPFSASMILFHYPKLQTPLTSIRRSIHTLHHVLGKIEPTGGKIEGLFGRNELEYKVLKMQPKT